MPIRNWNLWFDSRLQKTKANVFFIRFCAFALAAWCWNVQALEQEEE